LERSLPASSNLSRRVYSAAVFVPLFVFISYLGGIVFLLLIAILIVLGLSELFTILAAGGLEPMRITGYLIAVAVCLFTFLCADSPKLIVAGFTATVIFALLLFLVGRITGRVSGSLLSSIGGVLYVGWLFSLQIPLRETGAKFLSGSTHEPDISGWLLLMFSYALVWTCDTGAYFVGQRFGQRKLIPSVSPGKTVEGAIGGFMCTILVAFLFRGLFLRDLPIGMTLILGVTVGVVSQLGDIFESKLKRQGNLKDSSDLIPGHGGILDRFDGMLFAIPALYYILLAGV